jgi:hypothetical protein
MHGLFFSPAEIGSSFNQQLIQEGRFLFSSSTFRNFPVDDRSAVHVSFRETKFVHTLIKF